MGEASDFAREGWRACWLPILLVAAGHTLGFVNQHAARTDWRPGPWPFIAVGLMLFYVPLYGALYRTAFGGRPAEGRGVGGLQWGGVEWRLIAVGIVIAFLTGLALSPFLAVTGVLALVFGSHHLVSLGSLGSLTYWAVAAVPVWLVFVLIMAPRVARLTLGWAYSTAFGKTEPFAGWTPAKRSGWTIAIALALAWAPLLVGYLIAMALTMIESDTITPDAWPLPEAIGAGLLLGLLSAAVTAPLSVGVVCGAYWLLGERGTGPEAEQLPPGPPVEPPADAQAPPAPETERPAETAPGEILEPGSRHDVADPASSHEASAPDEPEPLSSWPHSVLPR